MWLFYIFIIHFFVSINASITPRCPPDTIQSPYDNKTCYLFVNEFKSFNDSESFCNGRGGNLAVVSSQFVNVFLSSMAFEKFGNFTKYWIGGEMKTVKMNAASSINVWGWTQLDRLMTFSDWDPTSTTTGNCTGVQNNTLWSATDCSLNSPFACQIPADFSYCDEGWAYFNLTNSCYKKFSVVAGLFQAAAENSCIQKGGHLASIHSVDEDRFICDLTSIGYNTTAYASIFWIGAKRIDNSNNWYWTDNTTFEYANWGHLYDYANRFCSEFWPDYTNNVNSPIAVPIQWNTNYCSYSVFAYLCKKSSNNAAMD